MSKMKIEDFIVTKSFFSKRKKKLKQKKKKTPFSTIKFNDRFLTDKTIKDI